MTRPLVRPSLLLCSIGALTVLGIGCGSSSAAPKGAKIMSFTLTDAGCVPNQAKAPAGPIEFEVENAGTSAVTEFEVLDGEEIVGEVENLSDGLSGEFSATLESGRYTLYCPGGSDERGALTVTAG
jgi:iron uptake system component EfeO